MDPVDPVLVALDPPEAELEPELVVEVEFWLPDELVWLVWMVELEVDVWLDCGYGAYEEDAAATAKRIAKMVRSSKRIFKILIDGFIFA